MFAEKYDIKDPFAFLIIATNLDWFKTHKEQFLSLKKNEEDVYDFIHHTICNTNTPSPVLMSLDDLKHLNKIFEDFMDVVAIYAKNFITPKSEHNPYGEHFEISRTKPEYNELIELINS